MVELIIVGTGAVAAEQTLNIEQSDYFWAGAKIAIKGYLEFPGYGASKYSGLYAHYGYTQPFLGEIDTYAVQPEDRFIIANGNNALRKQYAEALLGRGARFINLIHPTVQVAPTAKLGIGNIISPFSMIGPKAVAGDFNVLTSYSALSHDCRMGSYNFLSSSIVCGHVKIGDGNELNVRSAVIPDVEIGNGCVVQAGMVVDKNVPDGTTVFHRFKEKVLAIPTKQ